MEARAFGRRSKAWASEVATIASARTLWRVASTWIEQADGTYCAEFTHVSTGKNRIVRLCPRQHPDQDLRHTALLDQLV